MRRMWDAIAGLILTAMVLHFLFQMVKPYAPFIVIGGALMLLGARLYYKSRSW